MRIYKAKEVMLCWNPGTSEVAVVEWPDYARKSDKYEMSTLACNKSMLKMTAEKYKTMVFIEAIHAIVRDRCDPIAVHNALLHVAEYRSGLANDMPGGPFN